MDVNKPAPTPAAPAAPAQQEVDPKLVRKIEKGAEAAGTGIALGLDYFLGVRFIQKGKMDGRAGKIMGGIGGAFTVKDGIESGIKDVKCWKHPDNKHKWDDAVRIAGDATQVAAGGIMLASIKKGPKALLTGVLTGMAASVVKLVGKLGDDLPSNACQ